MYVSHCLFVCLLNVDYSANETLEICVYKNFPVDENKKTNKICVKKFETMT